MVGCPRFPTRHVFVISTTMPRPHLVLGVFLPLLHPQHATPNMSPSRPDYSLLQLKTVAHLSGRPGLHWWWSCAHTQSALDYMPRNRVLALPMSSKGHSCCLKYAHQLCEPMRVHARHHCPGKKGAMQERGFFE